MPPKIRFSRALIARNLSHSLTLYSRLSENGDDPPRYHSQRRRRLGMSMSFTALASTPAPSAVPERSGRGSSVW